MMLSAHRLPAASQSPFSAAGFTLIELLAVIAVGTAILVMAMPSLGVLSNTGNLNEAGSRIDNLLIQARQNAISKNTFTALILLNAAGGAENAYRTFAIFELKLPADGSAPTSANWAQISRWERLPDGVLADNTQSTFFTVPTMVPALPTISFKGQSYTANTGYAYQVFTPGGSLASTGVSSCTLVLKKGFFQAGAPVFPPSANFYGFTINANNGRTKITRP